MADSYAVAAQIRALAPQLMESTAAPFEDATLELWASDHGDPEINATLGPAGYTVPFDTQASTPAPIDSISAMLAIGYGLQTCRPYSSEQSEKGAWWIEQARALLVRIAKHELEVEGESLADAGSSLQYESQGEDMHVDSVFSGSVENWKVPTETRASS